MFPSKLLAQYTVLYTVCNIPWYNFDRVRRIQMVRPTPDVPRSLTFMTLPLLFYYIYYIHYYTTFHHLVQLPCFLQSKQDQLFDSIPMNNEIYHPRLIEHNNDSLHRHIDQSCVEYRLL